MSDLMISVSESLGQAIALVNQAEREFREELAERGENESRHMVALADFHAVRHRIDTMLVMSNTRQPYAGWLIEADG